MLQKGTILYIGGFELPDKNAAAQRVIGIAKCLRDLGYRVVFINALKSGRDFEKKEYFGFETLEYKREGEIDYLFTGKTMLSYIKENRPKAVIAYNYPAIPLNKIRKYCQSKQIKCIADATEWSKPVGGNIIYKIIKEFDTAYRMRYVQKHIDIVIAISRYLNDYYRNCVQTIYIPPLVDINDEKWQVEVQQDTEVTTFVYAGSPSAVKEKLDLLVAAIDRISTSAHVCLNIVGITEAQFRNIYNWQGDICSAVNFLGRIEHKKAVEMVKQAKWSVILRDNNRVVKAGFPTKFVESISCGTPVIANSFSNVDEYIESVGLMINDFVEIDKVLLDACYSDKVVDNEMFDYRKYTPKLSEVLL